jgi:hypothetical protein
MGLSGHQDRRTSQQFRLVQSAGPVLARMEKLAGHPIERFTPHDFRRTARSNTKRLKVDFETAEAMLNHVKKGMERTYDLYEMEDEKRLWFLKWEEEVAAIAARGGRSSAWRTECSGSGGLFPFCARGKPVNCPATFWLRHG